jgi:hypothetical protein
MKLNKWLGPGLDSSQEIFAGSILPGPLRYLHELNWFKSSDLELNIFSANIFFKSADRQSEDFKQIVDSPNPLRPLEYLRDLCGKMTSLKVQSYLRPMSRPEDFKQIC